MRLIFTISFILTVTFLCGAQTLQELSGTYILEKQYNIDEKTKDTSYFYNRNDSSVLKMYLTKFLQDKPLDSSLYNEIKISGYNYFDSISSSTRLVIGSDMSFLLYDYYDTTQGKVFLVDDSKTLRLDIQKQTVKYTMGSIIKLSNEFYIDYSNFNELRELNTVSINGSESIYKRE